MVSRGLHSLLGSGEARKAAFPDINAEVTRDRTPLGKHLQQAQAALFLLERLGLILESAHDLQTNPNLTEGECETL